MSAKMMPQRKPRFSEAIKTKGYQSLIYNTLGDPSRAQRFIASITSAVAVNGQLQECDAGSILAGSLLGESLGLQPSPQLGQYYLVPFDCKVKGPDGKALYKTDENGNKLKDAKGHWIAVTEKKAQFVLGYHGYIQLALRTGQYRDMGVVEIRQGEYLGRDPSTGKPRFQFEEDDSRRMELPVIGYMAYFEYLNGFQKTLYWSRQKMMNHADTYSAAFSADDYQRLQEGQIPKNELWKYSSFWYKEFDAMAEKTMLRQLISKWGVMTTDVTTAFERDGRVMEVSQDGKSILPEMLAPADEPEPPAPLQIEGTPKSIEIPRPEMDEVVEAVDLSSL